MKKYLSTAVLVICITVQPLAQSVSVKWKFKTADKILAPPVIDDNTVYVGSEDGNFYAVDSNTGKEKWHFKTRGRIQGQATLHRNLIIFESDNNFHALDKHSGSEVWKHEQSSALWAYKIDPYDDKHSKGIVHNNTFYVGSSLGYVLGLNVETGKRVDIIRSEYGQPVRTTPLIRGTRLFYGDWAGKVYAYSLDQKKPLWTQETYDEKLYESFGGIVSELVSYDGKLFFGARNHNFQVLNDISGSKAWTYADSTGGWIVGDPVIKDEVMYIGGSDNLKMFAFRAKTGELIWENKVGLNIYTKPIITENEVIFTGGNSYNHDAPGALFVLNRTSGELISKLDLPKGSFSSPVTDGKHIYFGAYDGHLYAVSLN